MSTTKRTSPARPGTSVRLSLLVLLVSLVVAFQVFRFTKAETEREVGIYFDFRVREAISRIDNRLQAYEQVLRGAAGVFIASGIVTRREFNQYVSALKLTENYPGIQGLGFARYLRPEEREAHVAAVRREGFPAYVLRPAGEREAYTAIVYIEPFSDLNLRAFGYDMYSEPVRHKAMHRALESGELAVSGKVRLIQESERHAQAGFLMYLPVYGNDRPHSSLQEKSGNFVGWVYAPFRMDDFMAGLLGERANDLDIEIYDGEGITPTALMYDSDGSKSSATPTSAAEYVSHRVRLGGHSWTVQIRPLPLIESRIDTRKPVVAAVVGAGTSFFLTAMTWMLLTGRERALRIAKNMNRELIHEQQRLNSILDGTRVGTWEWNVQTGETVFNEYWAQIVGYQLRELEPVSIDTWLSLVHPDDARTSAELLQRHFSGQLDYYECEVRMRHKDGHWVWVLNRGKVATWTKDGKPQLMFGTHQDITRRKLDEEKMRSVAQHDALTRLPNRVLLDDRLKQALAFARRNHTRLAVMFIDLDKFKPINDHLGHDAGDMVLKEVARRIRNALRESDTVARIGGDEFVVLLPTIATEEDARLVAETIRHSLDRPFALDGRKILLTSSIGVAIYPEHGSDENQLVRNADAAMYRTKACAGDGVAFYHADTTAPKRVPDGAV